jgi:hypothetical protein
VVGIDWPYLATWLPMVTARWDGETALSASRRDRLEKRPCPLAGAQVPFLNENVIRMSSLSTQHSETIRLRTKLLNRQLCGTSGL